MVAEKAPIPQVFRSWDEYSRKLDEFRTCDPRGWIFRGEVGRGDRKDAKKWKPEFPSSTLERSIKAVGLPLSKAPIVEESLLREFKRRAHHYLSDPPAPQNTLEWLALMRHYGAPVRLLDCTYSAQIATFFSVYKKSPTDQYVIWAFQSNWFTRESNAALNLEPLDFDHLRPLGDRIDWALFADHFLLRQPRVKCLHPVNPYRLNDRLTVQQGVFLCPGDITSTIEGNANALPVSKIVPIEILVLNLDTNERVHFLQQLHRMGIDSASLFPGLQGFAESLNTRVAMPWIHNPTERV